MARISLRDFLRFRNTILPSKPCFPSNPFRSSSSFNAPKSIFQSSTSSPSHQFLALLDASQSVIQISQIHAHLIASGQFNSFWARKILKLYWDFGDLDYSILIFGFIDSPGTYCVNTVIKAYSASSVPNKAVGFYFELLNDGFSPNSHSFVPIVSACAKMGCVDSGLKCHGQVVKNGVEYVLPVQNSLIHMYSCCGHVELAWKVFDEMPMRDLVSWNSIVDGYARVGNLDVAHMMFDKMPGRNVTSWNIMMSGYLRGGVPGCVLKLFREMRKKGLRGSDTTMVNVLTACSRSARLKEGRSVHGFLIKTLLKFNIYLDTALIDMYSKCQRVKVASRVFGRMEKKNLVSWNAIILGHSIHGNPEDGIKLFNEMVGRTIANDRKSNSSKSLMAGEVRGGVLPDEYTFVGVLCACARAKLLEEGKEYFQKMVFLYGIKPNFTHYWCLANIFSSVGLAPQAEEIIRKIPENVVDVESESYIWANLLSSGRFQGDVSLGEQIAKSLIESEPQNLSYYRLLLNVYAVAGRWEEVAKVKEMMKGEVSGRMAGCNLVDLKEIVHNLKVGETWKVHKAEGNVMLAGMAQKLKAIDAGT
ncbi:hypothetical protein UlMin_039739 [Ulmus minor]